MTRTRAAWIVVAACVFPRLVVLLYERHRLLDAFTEKSDRFARTLADSGTFGFIPGVPSGYTQPLYAFFLAPLYWTLGRSWPVVGIAQVLVAVATALLVLELGRRVHSLAAGLIAALITTLHPYLIWHDVHVNREILDGFVAVALTLATVIAAERHSYRLAALVGVISGVAVLGNSRLALLPLVLAIFVAWRVRPSRRALAIVAVVLVATTVAVAPWVVRNRVSVGCYAVTTDARALWKANNLTTRPILAQGKWIDDVPELPGAPPWPELAADLTLSGKPTTVDECAQMRFYRNQVTTFWREHPGEKARLSVQAIGMLWRPSFTVGTDTTRGGLTDSVKRIGEPAYMSIVFALALVGLFLAPRRFVWLTVILLGYGTFAAMVFAGTVRYRVPWDFLPALLAAIAVLELRSRRLTKRKPA